MNENSIPPRVVRWTQKLLDLSLRNRLLNAKESRELIPLACTDLARLEDKLASSDSIVIASGDLTDNFLVSKATPEETKKRLTHLFRIAKTDLEDSGVNTLFLAIGMLKWIPPAKDAKPVRAPILMMPVKLVRKSVNDIRLAAIDDETLVNPTLVELLRSQYHVTVKGVDPVPEDGHGTDVEAVLKIFTDSVKDLEGWEVERTAALGRFSFGKFVMWKDLTARLGTLRHNPLVNHLIEGGGAYDDGVEVFPPEEIAENLNLADLFCPMSADSSQLAAVLYSALGKTFVLHGPPGTGKSQTITNLIAHNLAHGRRVLFVSEKKAALDVVHKRLEKIGLKPFCLELHSNKSGKAEVLAQFAEALNTPVVTEGPERARVAAELEAERKELSGYVNALHKQYPNGLSAYDCFSQLILRDSEKPPRNLVDIDTLHQTPEEMSAARETAAHLATDFAAAGAEAVKSLAALKPGDWTPEVERRLASAAEDLKSASAKGFFAKFFAAFKHRGLVTFGKARKLTPEEAAAFAAAVPKCRGVYKYLATKEQAKALGLQEIAGVVEHEGLDPDRTRALFDFGYADNMLGKILSENPALAKFNGLDHAERIKRYRELDDKLAELAKKAAFAKITDKMPLSLNGKCDKTSELGILRRECEKKMRHKPIRQLLALTPNLAPQLKPCFLMSPLSVAQYLPPDAPPFDLVVFDEASQIPVWDAIGVIARGKQFICVGDPKQMPPTNFFNKGDNDDGADEEDEEIPEDLESILDECLAAGVSSTHLNWHYRSRHESLIQFSNHNYYEDRLYTFPSADRSPRLGVRFAFVEGGVYDRRATRTNRKEAEALVEWVFSRIKEPGYKPRSVGVVTFSQAQKDLIENLFEERREKDPSCEAFFSENAEEPFFVKNLENVQGDERDVILFSIGYAPDKDGKMTMNFGPLNRDGGERRLNVAVTRAKQQVVVFSSIHGSQIDLERTSAVGAKHLRDFLKFAEKGEAESNASKPKDNGAFPKAVAEFLRGKGYTVDEQVGSGACRIDLAVKKPGEDTYALAIECDGPSYASQLTVRDRDQLRHSVLKGLGWRITRIWSVDWALDRTRAENSLLALLK